MSVPISSLPAAQRPRERLAELGPHALSDGELLALLLGHGRRGESALELATALLAEHGGVAGLAAARPEELARRPGVGAAKAAAIIAAFQLGVRARSSPEPAPPLYYSEDVMLAARPLFAGARVERLLVLVCDARNRLRRRVFVAQGAIDEVAVPVREILNTVLRHDGRAFAIAHNHPSGDPTPSVDDRRASTILAAAARTVGLRFLDHVVIAGEQWSSADPLASE
ncbi:DNA repair protein [Nocardia donostiensis]|uniref:JAB domain-containing protein n=1 Tax=Nocardia donostiensis TaxID=1538463 RepID=UPI0009D998B9|nr:DNA repair protein RadC [Nocardia donostiensis]OQS14578.1 DNA repair protein [Nocardia donostiensis]